jgi:hypothetical protein
MYARLLCGNREIFVPPGGNRCACRKLNPGISVMESAQDWATKNVPGAIDGARDRCHLSPGIDECASHCNISCNRATGDGGVARRLQQRGRGIPVGSNRSVVQHIHFAKGSAVRRSVANAYRSESADKDLTIGPVPITNEIAGSLSPAACFRDLICHSAVGCAVTPHHRICRRLCPMISNP